jgi:hypothetical protein
MAIVAVKPGHTLTPEQSCEIRAVVGPKLLSRSEVQRLRFDRDFLFDCLYCDDVAIRLAPLDAASADAMLDDLRGARLLRGVRGRSPIDRAAVIAMLVALGRLGLDRPDVLEVDLNPVIATADGALAVDALVVLAGPPR